ncbi:MAG: NYN domain-containing protein [Burkholderiaceae bacterium]|nr:NYN domain-containing protein [Burkholderiaceae bacterium]
MKTMLLIDADNVSVGVMEQAVAALLKEHGALHVRRAYCTAESAAKHQAVFKRLGIRPVVNLATGKNSTDIAMAIDALDLAIAERPDVVAIASSDSDFAPLVLRLREKGCRVVGIGQAGKTGDETQTVYDAFTVFAHRAAAAAKKGAAPAPAPTVSAPAPTKAPARKTAARKAPTRKTPQATAAPVTKAVSEPASPPAPAPAPARVPAPAPARPPAPAQAPQAATPVAATTAGTPPDRLRQILMALPELVRGDTVELRVAAERLRAAGLLSKSGASTRVFKAHDDRFELLPASNPNRVRLRG